MFDFEKLRVYKESKRLNREVLKFVRENKRIDPYLRNQLKRASISIVINVAEGSGRFSKADRKHFYTIARGSAYECVSLLDIIAGEGQMEENLYKALYQEYEDISKMLLGLIKSQNQSG
jgi:four helix bundle protein